ncbi:hypothetical protein EZV62_011795 [Acer yangbiense]|uniref:GAG-pre-integrase domain-containing protein n=1 Tax=Acer yangbiense TaxID=1000413 RepID=A0A5C7I6A6_9ROSI|nr:hypothetical protein EZV62_011795 [Acer yangbiense]
MNGLNISEFFSQACSLQRSPELPSLSSLSALEIKDCNDLKSLQGIMKHCARLGHLVIESCDSLTSIAEGQLPSSLKRLKISSCVKLQCLLDGREDTNHINASRVEYLYVSQCPALESLSSRVQLSVQHLEIQHCSSITTLGQLAERLERLETKACHMLDSLSSGQLPASLKYLSIFECPIRNLSSTGQLPESLQHLDIKSCSQLTSLSSGQLPAPLKYLKIHSCGSLISIAESLQNLSSLREIDIFSCRSLKSFPADGLLNSNLTILSIRQCEKLVELPSLTHTLNSLKELHILNNIKLVSLSSFPQQGFPSSLTSLSITGRQFYDYLMKRLHKLTSLRSLHISRCQDAKSFPEETKAIILPTCLTRLALEEFEKLESLSPKGFRNLTSLEYLSISKCSALTSFPKEGLVSSLLELHISECSQLKDYCLKNRGRDKSEMANIPYWLVRPVLETHGWDHEGINAEKLFVIKDKIPISFSGQITKDKKDANVQMELASSVKHGDRRNNATAGLSVTHLGDTLSAGLKLEDNLIVIKRLRVVMTGAAKTGRHLPDRIHCQIQAKDVDGATFGFGQWIVRHHHHPEKGRGLGCLGGLSYPDCTRVLATECVMGVELETKKSRSYRSQSSPPPQAADRRESGLSPPPPKSSEDDRDQNPGVRSPDPTPLTANRRSFSFTTFRFSSPFQTSWLSCYTPKADFLMQLLFEFQELWTVVSEDIASPADAATTRKDIKARAECRSRKQNFQANVAEDGGRSETLLLACNMAEDGAKNKWFLDSGCSNHMCGEKEMFTQLDESFTSSVKFGNDTTVPVMGKGKISITLKDGSQNAISDVLFVPNLHKNLLSVGQLSEKGYDIRIHEGICTINSAQKGLIAKVKMSQNRLFPLLINSDSLPCFSSVMCDENWLWHMWFGHVNFGSLKQLASRKMVLGLPSINPPDRVCETCVLGKKHRDPFPIGKAWRASALLEAFSERLHRKLGLDRNPGSSSDVNVDLEEIVQEEPTYVTPPPCVTPHLAESSSRPQRQRVLPARLQDCVLSNDDYPTDEELVNFALFADCDPVTYEDAAQDDYWMKVMNEEIYLGLMSYFLGIEVSQTDDGIFLCQKKYAGDVLKKFKMEGCKPILTPVEERLKLVKDGSGLGSLNHVHLIYDIRGFLSLLGNASVVFNNRSSNSLADSLAKKGSAMGGDSLVWEDL